MVYECYICKKDFKSTTYEDLNTFCKHVGRCSVRSDNILADRFSCNACGNVVQRNQSFKNHLLKCQPPAVGSRPTTSSLSRQSTKLLNTFKERREEGNY